MALSVNQCLPTYRDLSVSFTGPTSSGNATVHYVEAGLPYLPTLVLYHGFPSSSNQYRDLIPLLSDTFHILAPDFPGYGQTKVASDFHYTFANLAAITAAWLRSLDVKEYIMYIFDYGAPIGLRIALNEPSKVQGVISQNGNAYNEGFGEAFWAPIFALWNASNAEPARQHLSSTYLTLASTEYQYTAGFPEQDLVLRNPEAWTLDYLQNLAGAENQEHQLDLFYDYRTNVPLYSKFQEYFKSTGVPILAIWGKGDPVFVHNGAEAFQELPGATIQFVDAGHFALETKRCDIAQAVKAWWITVGRTRITGE